MPDMYVDSGGAVIVPLNLMPLIDDTDFKSIEPALVYNSAGLVLTWNFQTTAGVMTSTAITATTSGVHDISEPLANVGMYGIEIPASGGNWANDGNAARVGVGWFTGVATGILPWRGPTIGFRAAVINNREIDGAGTGTELTAIPWNAAWDAEVQSECDDAITANAVVLDIPTTTEFNARTMPTADYVVVGDTIAGCTLVTTCTTNTDVTALATEVGKIPKSDGTSTWNNTALAAIQSECNDAFVAYDPPTATEMTSAFTEIKGATWSAATDTIEMIHDDLVTAQGNITTIMADTDLLDDAVGGILDIHTDVASVKTVVDANGVLLLDIPTVTEFNARTLASADYVVVGDTIAACTAATVTAIGNNVITAASIADAAIDNATFAADVGTTAYATNNIALAADKAILNYDGPTNTEFELRTLPSADYVVVGDTIAGVTTVTTCTTNTDMVAEAPSAATIADAVWDEVVTTGQHDTATYAGAGLLAAASAGDPWSTAIPGAYGAGTAGLLLGTTIPNAIDAVDNFVDTEITTLTTEVGKIPKSDGTSTWNATALAAIETQCDDAITANTLVLDLPTTTEFNARTLPSADYVVVGDTIAGVTTVTTCTTNTDMVAEAPSADTIATAVWAEAVPGSYTAGQAGHLIGNMPTLASAVDAMWDEGTGGHVTPTTTGKALIDAGAAGTPPTVGEIRTEMDSNSTQLAAIVADTNELQTNQGAWATATGFATAANVTTAHSTTDGLINALNDFDPALDAVASVTLVGTCTTNTDMVTEPPTALVIADQVWDEVATDHVTATTFGKLMLALKTLLGHKSSENEAGTTVTYRTASDAADAGTMTWDETNKTRGEYSGF